MPLEEVNEEYETKMAGFELDCNEGKGDQVACHHTAEFYSVVHDNHLRSSKIYTDNCTKRNYTPSCFNLAKLFLSGKGVAQNDEQAETLFKKSCAGDHMAACYYYGAMKYLKSNEELTKLSKTDEITPKIEADMKILKSNLFEANDVLERNCLDRGDNESCYFAGSHHIKADESYRNPVKALAFFERSCALNHAASCYNIAVLYKKGDTGIEKNDKLFEEYKLKTEEFVKLYGSVGGRRTG